MDALIEYLLKFGHLNPQQVNLVKSETSEIDLKKDAYFSEAGKVARQVGFVTEGIVRVCYYTNKGEETTRYFIDENNFVVDLNSFTSQTPSSEYIQAVMDCRLIVFSADAWKELSLTIIGWDAIISKITAKALLQKVERISPMRAQDATARYLSFFEKFPQVANRVPLLQLASYLGITQSSLSRIRKNISR